MLADRFGGRAVFAVLMFFVAVPVALVPHATSYRNLLVVGFFLRMAGSSFAVGVGYVSRWFSMESQGSALGVYGLGNIGQSAAVFLGPVVAAAYGYRAVYWGMSEPKRRSLILPRKHQSENKAKDRDCYQQDKTGLA
jgi:NNP family nitrate/nitrite transporter-like MFS transporter